MVSAKQVHQFIEALKELIGRCCLALSAIRSSRSKAVKKEVLTAANNAVEFASR
jgi:hypothetical protein